MNASDSHPVSQQSVEGWDEPNDDLVNQVLIRLGDVQHKKVFYEGLNNPLWVGALASRHVFDKAPEMSVDSSGHLRSRLWPEGEYLVRMAALVPGDVAKIFGQVAATDNLWVQRIIVNGVAGMPAKQAKRLVRFIIEYLNGPYRAYLAPEKMIAIANSLQAAEYTTQALKLLTALYRPRKDPAATDLIGRRTVQAGLGGYEYGRSLPESVPTLVVAGEKGLRAVIGWLIEHERLTRVGDPAANYDTSHIWRPSIARSDRNRTGDEIGHALVDTVLEVALGCVDNNVDLSIVLARLDATSELLLRRISLEFLAQLIERSQEPIDNVLEVATTRLVDRRSLTFGLWFEYAHLARVMLSQALPDSGERWITFIRSDEIYPSENDIRGIIAYADRNTGDVTDQEITDYRNRRRLELLAAIGRDHLPGELVNEFDQLAEKYRLPKYPGQPGFVEIGGFVGATSPLSQAELADLDDGELIGYLKSWQPVREGLWGPSIEGLARQVEQLVRSDPGRLAERASELRALRVAYIHAALYGWHQALGDSTDFSTGTIWDLAAFVAHQADDDRQQAARLYEGDIIWRDAQQEVARLISTYLRGDKELSVHLARLLWELLRPLTTHTDPTPDREVDITAAMDPLTVSLNSVRPEAIRTMAHLLDALGRHDLLNADSDLVANILQDLGAHIGPQADPSLATAAVFGEVMGILLNAVPDWLDAHADVLLGGIVSDNPAEQAWSDVVFSVMVAVYGPSLPLLRHVRGWYEASFDPAYIARAKTVGWHNMRTAEQHVADHILLLYIHGVIEFDDPLMRLLFSATTAESRGGALGHLGWQFMHADREEAVKARARDLVDWRVKEIQADRASILELGDFYWWVKSDQFSPEWWLPILELVASNSDFNPHSMLGPALAEAAPSFPRQVVTLLHQLMPGQSQTWQRYDLVENAPAILASALDSDNEAARDTARKLMDRLGRDGYTDLDQAVDRQRRKG